MINSSLVLDSFPNGESDRKQVVNSREEQIAELRAAIAAREALHSTLGGATVDLSLKPLRGLFESHWW